MDFLDRAFDEGFYTLVKTLRDSGAPQYMMIRANIESDMRGLIKERAGTNADLKDLLLQKLGLQLKVLDFAFSKFLPLFEKKKKLKDILAELQKEGKNMSPEVTGKVDHFFEIYQLVIKGKPLPPATG